MSAAPAEKPDPDLKVLNPSIIVSQWIPMGINNMVSLNRHLGSHKKYAAPTEFGMLGEVESIKDAEFKMNKPGVFLYSVDFDFSNFVDAHLRCSLDSKQIVGLRVDKSGLASFGVGIPDSSLSFDEVKITIGKLTYRFVDYLFPMLTDVQQDMLNILYDVEDILKSHFTVTTYALIITESLGVSAGSSKQFLEEYPLKVDAITDWILQDVTIDTCQVFIGMRAAICVGNPSRELQTALQHVLFIKSIFNVSLNLFSLIWNLGKKLRLINKQVPNAGYKALKGFNFEIGKLNNELSLLSVLDEMFQVSIRDKQEAWNNSGSKKSLPENVFNIDRDFHDENAKTEDRRLILKELTTYLEGVRDNIEQRMDLILTKNSEYLNLIVLALTVITVISVADIFSFNLDQWAVVILAMIPFAGASLIYVKNYLKNFKL
ncbi:MAG: hypothetical protein JW839_21725 [Candidatus Lokiarchaeota archaeon]|nr:hypothetical protein [Candidatus Lokiarchaeota archaeon]